MRTQNTAKIILVRILSSITQNDYPTCFYVLVDVMLQMQQPFVARHKILRAPVNCGFKKRIIFRISTSHDLMFNRDVFRHRVEQPDKFMHIHVMVPELYEFFGNLSYNRVTNNNVE